ncbi:MAG: hypothetical protein ABIJ21_07145 [Nanoarchaeota archaeon]
MADIRKIIIIFIIAILFTIFVFSLNTAVNEAPKHEKYCRQYYESKPILPGTTRENCTAVEPTAAESASCTEREGSINYEYDSVGCPTSWSCNTCQKEYNDVQDQYRFWQFIIAAAFGLIAIIIGLFVPGEKNSLMEAISTGFLLGGLITLFIGTGLSFSSFYKWLRPIIILFELLLVIYIAFKKLKK